MKCSAMTCIILTTILVILTTLAYVLKWTHRHYCHNEDGSAFSPENSTANEYGEPMNAFKVEAAKLSSQLVDGKGRTNENEANAIHRRSPSTTAAKWAKKSQQNGPNRFHSSNTNQSPSGQVMDSLIWNIWQANGNWHGRRRRR